MPSIAWSIPAGLRAPHPKGQGGCGTPPAGLQMPPAGPCPLPSPPAPCPAPTSERGGEAEDVEVVQVPVAGAVAADARGEVQPSAGFAGQADGVVHGAVGQPARVAPVQTLAPGLEELAEGGDEGALLPARSLGLVEVEAVLPAGRLVGEHHAWGADGALR